MKKVEAIIKPFKLDDGEGGASRIGHQGADRDRGQGVRPAERPYRAVPGRGICRSTFLPKVKSRGRGRGYAARPRGRGDPAFGAHRAHRRRQDIHCRNRGGYPHPHRRNRSPGDLIVLRHNADTMSSLSGDNITGSHGLIFTGPIPQIRCARSNRLPEGRIKRRANAQVSVTGLRPADDKVRKPSRWRRRPSACGSSPRLTMVATVILHLATVWALWRVLSRTVKLIVWAVGRHRLVRRPPRRMDFITSGAALGRPPRLCRWGRDFRRHAGRDRR